MRRIINLWRQQRGDYFFMCARRGERWIEQAFRRSEFGDVARWVRDHADCDVWWCVQSFSKPRRLERYAVPTPYAWLDLDPVDPRRLPLEPIIALETSPISYQAIWRCNHIPTKAMRRGFSQAVGGDRGAWIITKLLRVPNTVNFKYPQMPLVQVIWWCDEPIVDLRRYADGDGHNGTVDCRRKPKGDARAIILKYLDKSMLPGLNVTLLDACQPPRGEIRGTRSSVVHKIGRLLFEAGATEDEVACAMFASASFRSKWGTDLDRLWKEVDAARRRK
jgi:hypothetical protein